MKHGLHDVCSIFGAGFTEQSTVRLWVQRAVGSESITVSHLGWEAQRTLANFSPCRALTQLPSGRCSRRSTLFPTTHIGIFSSVESCRGTEKAETGPASPVGEGGGGGHRCDLYSYLDLIHPRSDAEKAALWSDVVEEQDSVSFPEIGPGNATKPIKRAIVLLVKGGVICLSAAVCRLSFTSPAPPCPISAGWSSPHPQACSSFGNQHLNEKINVSGPTGRTIGGSALTGLPTQRCLNVSSELVQRQPQQEAGLPRSRISS